MRARLSKEELKQIPLRYRLLLKVLLRVPNPSFPFFIVKRLTWIEGVFWALIVPAFLVVYFMFSVWFMVFLSLYIAFPLNIAIWLLIPGLFFVLFVRIVAEREILFWKHLNDPHKEWDVSKSVEELLEIIERQKRKH